jgi:hypothetical protein
VNRAVGFASADNLLVVVDVATPGKSVSMTSYFRP